MYNRFVHPNTIDDMNAREGFFCAAYDMREDPRVDAWSAERLEDLLGWFRTNLTIPKTFNRSRAKNARKKNTRGLAWFKDDAREALEKSYELIALLQENGYPVEIIRTDRVGYIVYEDDDQVIAEPFSDTPV